MRGCEVGRFVDDVRAEEVKIEKEVLEARVYVPEVGVGRSEGSEKAQNEARENAWNKYMEDQILELRRERMAMRGDVLEWLRARQSND
jgi:hypothetical protein